MTTDYLFAALEQADAIERRRILRDLPPTNDPATLGLIARSLSDPSTAVCEAAIEALTRHGGHDAAEAAAPGLRSNDPAQRGYAVDALIRLGSDAIPTMTTLLADPDHDVRKYAAEALATVGDQRAVAALGVLLEDRDVTVAAAAAEALGLLGLPDAIPALAEVARDGLDWLRVAAIFGLGEIGGPVALAHICATPPEAPFPVLASAVEAVGRAASAEPARALAFLAELVADDDRVLTDLALRALGSVLDLQPSLSVPQPTRQTLARVARLRLSSPDPQLRAASARCFGAVPEAASPEGVAMLRVLLASDGETSVRLEALRALASTGGVTSATLVGLAADEGEDSDFRVAALRLLTSHADRSGPDVVRLLVRVVTAAEQPLVRAAALRALLQVESTEALRHGLDVLDDEGVRDDEPAVAELSACPVEARLALAWKALDEATPATRRWTFTSLLPVSRASDVRAADGGPNLLARAALDDDRSVRAHALRLLDDDRDVARLGQELTRSLA